MRPSVGDFVRVRSRRWLVESVSESPKFPVVRLACIDDDAPGEVLEVLGTLSLMLKSFTRKGGSKLLSVGQTIQSPFRLT